MKRKFLPLTVFVLLCCSGAVRGQEDYQYRPFETGAVWSVNNFKFGSFGDTVIGDREYVKLYRQESDQNFSFDLSQATYWGAFRNDTAGKKVYFAIPAGVHIYTMNPFSSYVTESDTELLFYDFSMALGDTVTCHFFEEENLNVICTKVSRVSFGSIYAGYHPTSHHGVFLNFQDNDSTDCFARSIGGGVQNFERLTLSVYPSPACDIIRIECGQPESTAGTLTIWDVTGKQHYLSNTQLSQQLDVSPFPKGLYFIRFTSERDNWSGKFIKL